MWIVFRGLLAGALRDRISLFYALIFPAVTLAVLAFFFEDPGYRRHLLVGLTALGGFFFTMSGTGFEVMRQRRRGVYKLLRATPFSTGAFVSALTAARGLIALICTLLVYVGGALSLGFGVAPAGLLLMLPPLLLGTACFTALGFILGNLGNTETQVAGINNLFILPMTFASPVFYSLDAAPRWVQLVSEAMPLTHLVAALQAAAAGDPGAMVRPLAILLGFTAGILAVAVLTFRWDPDAGLLRRA